MMRREQAGQKAERAAKKIEFVKYEITEDGTDVLLLSGQYANERLLDLWVRGPVERDYIVKKLYSTGDEAVINIIHSASCK
jgi:hypothetical protein